MQKMLLVLTLMICGITAKAQEVWGKGGGMSYSMAGIEGGFRWNSADLTGSSSNKQVLGLQIGGSVVFDLAENFGIKTGLFYVERPFKSEFGTDTGTGKVTYFDVPLLAMFKFADYAGVYAGPSLGIKLGDEYSQNQTSGAKLLDIKGTVIPITFGAQFKMTPAFGLNLFFETVTGDLAKDVKSSRAVGANLLFTFD